MTPASVGLVEPRAAAAASGGRWWLLMGGAASLLALVHVFNPGASFSFLADAGGWQRQALTAFGAAVSVALAVLLWRGVRGRLETAAFVGLIGGTLGNVVDRVRVGAVVDYIDLHWHGMHWPAFNLADIFIVGSAMLLLRAFYPIVKRMVNASFGQVRLVVRYAPLHPRSDTLSRSSRWHGSRASTGRRWSGLCPPSRSGPRMTVLSLR